MGIKYDVWFSEREELHETGKVEKVIEWLKEKDLAYEEEGALWFRAKQFGDEKDRILKKSDGDFTYFGVDCAYHKNKFEERKFNKAINIWGADHHGDVKRLKGFVEVLGYKDQLEIILMQFVRLVKDGKPVRMSKREAIYILLEDVLNEVGRDVFRFFMLQYSPNTHMDFNLDSAKEQSEKNPVFYVQYAHARICSILKKINNQESRIKNLELLNHQSELNLIKQLIRLPEIIEDIAKDYQVQRIPQYALDLATSFHQFY